MPNEVNYNIFGNNLAIPLLGICSLTFFLYMENKKINKHIKHLKYNVERLETNLQKIEERPDILTHTYIEVSEITDDDSTYATQETDSASRDTSSDSVSQEDVSVSQEDVSVSQEDVSVSQEENASNHTIIHINTDEYEFLHEYKSTPKKNKNIVGYALSWFSA